MNNAILTKAPLVGLLLLGAVATAQAQTLSLSPSATTVPVGGVVTYTIYLNNAANVGDYDFNVLFDPSQLQILNPAAPVTSSSANATDFPLTLLNTLDPNGTVGDMEFANSTQPGAAAINPSAAYALGTFQAQVLGVLPSSGSALTFGALGTGALGGSEVDDNTTFANVLTGTTGATVFTPAAVNPAVPESSSLALLGLGLLPFGLIALRRRAA